MQCHWQKKKWNQEGPFTLPFVHSINPPNIYFTLVTVLSDKRKKLTQSPVVVSLIQKSQPFCILHCWKEFGNISQNQRKHTRSKNRGLCCLKSSIHLWHTQKPHACFHPPTYAFGLEITPSKIKLWFWAWAKRVRENISFNEPVSVWDSSQPWLCPDPVPKGSIISHTKMWLPVAPFCLRDHETFVLVYRWGALHDTSCGDVSKLLFTPGDQLNWQKIKKRSCTKVYLGEAMSFFGSLTGV